MDAFTRAMSDLRSRLITKVRTLPAGATVASFEQAMAAVSQDPNLCADPLQAKRLLLHGLVIELLGKRCSLELADRVVRRCRRCGYLNIVHRLICEGWFIKILQGSGEHRRAKLIRTRVAKAFLQHCDSVNAEPRYRKTYLRLLD